MSTEKLEELLDELHIEYLKNLEFNNTKNIKLLSTIIQEETMNINWSDYNRDLYEKYNTLFNSLNHHLIRWK